MANEEHNFVSIDDLVAAALDANNPKRLSHIDSEVTEANFGSTRPLRSDATVMTLRELGLRGWSSRQTVIATIDQKRARPIMAEVLSYATGGWGGRASVWFILEDGSVGSLHRTGTRRLLHLYDSGYFGNWYSRSRVLVFGK